MKATKTINVARDYCVEPAGRFPSDGEFSGSRFRKEFLVPAIESGALLVVDFDGTEGYGSSFLEEAFGGLVREEGRRAEELRSAIKIVSEEDPSVVDEVWQYIDSAKPKEN